MSKHPIIVHGQTTVRQAAMKMHELNLGMLLVGSQQFVTGILTDRDLLLRGLNNDRNPDNVEIATLIDHPPVVCHSYQTVEEAVAIMEENKIRRLLVVDEEDMPTGVLTLDDVAVRHDDERLVARALHRIAEDVSVPMAG